MLTRRHALTLPALGLALSTTGFALRFLPDPQDVNARTLAAARADGEVAFMRPDGLVVRFGDAKVGEVYRDLSLPKAKWFRVLEWNRDGSIQVVHLPATCAETLRPDA